MEKEPDLPIPYASKTEEIANKDDIECSATNYSDIIEEADGSLTNFDGIVKRMNEDVLVEYLHDILAFLLSDRSQLRINASGCSELFLANLLKSLDNLNCKYYNKRCANMTKQVGIVLDNNADRYKCITMSENVGGKKYVVYKKECLSKCRMSGEEDSCCTSNLQSITENLHSDCPNHQNHKVPQDFKMRWLKTTLRFIKDESKLVYKYPEMSPMEATFVYSIITRCKQTEISPSSFFMPLKEAMQIFGLKYFFELNYIHTDRNGKMLLMLEKIPKNIKSIIEGDKRCSNRFRNLKFIKQPKTRTSDETRATRVVSRLKNQERYKPEANRLCEPTAADFERRLKENPGVHPDLHVYYATDVDRLQQLVPKRSRQNQALGRSAVDDVDGASSSRGGRRDSSCSETRTEKLLKDMSMPIKSDKAIKMMSDMGWGGGALGARGNGITEPIIPALKLQPGAGLGYSPEPKKEPIGYYQQKSKAGVGHTPSAKKEARNNHKQQSGAGFGHTPSPKKVPKGNKYPEQSGAGQTHTPSNKKEPVGKYQQQSAANLGHSPLQTVEVIKAQHQNDRRHSRLEMFQYILEMVTSNDTVVREIKYDRCITKKEKGFFTYVLRGANERNNIGVTSPEEQRLWTGILEAMIANPDLHIKTTLSDDCKRLTLKKDDTPYVSQKKKRKIKKKASIANIPPLTEGNKKIITNDFLRHLTDNYVSVYVGRNVSTKAETGVTFRVVILIHLLDIVKSDRMETVIELERAINDKEKDYVENTIMTIGTRKKRGGSKLEQELLKEIKDNLEGYLLRKQFIDDRTFVVRKIENKILDKASLDLSYTTCSTDDNDKHYLTSRCSDDTDAGHDDILDNDDNDGDDELIDNNHRTEASKFPEIHQIKTEEDASAVVNMEVKLLHEAVSFDENKEKIESIGLDEDDNPQDTKSHVCEMDVQDYGKKTTYNNFPNLIAENVLKETECDLPNSNVQDFEKDSEFIDMMTDDLEKHTVSTLQTDVQGLGKHINYYSKTDMPDVKKSTGIELNSETDVRSSEKINSTESEVCKGNHYGIDVVAVTQNIEKIAEINASKRDCTGKNSVFDVLKSYVEHFNKNPEIRLLQNIERTEKNTDSNVLDIDLIKNSNESEHNITIPAGDNITKKDKANVALSNVRRNEDMETDIPQTSNAVKNGSFKSTKVNEAKYMKRVYLMPREYPIVEVDTEFAKSLQFIISKEIDVSKDLPLLKCHGVQDGALIYSCHSENTLRWLEKVCDANNIKIVIPTNDVVRYKMSLKINSFINYTSDKLFKMLHLYNEGLATANWIELSVEKSRDSLTFLVELDDKSLKYIKESNFSLFAGIDQVQFHPVWN